jgi:hypothetical protein
MSQYVPLAPSRLITNPWPLHDDGIGWRLTIESFRSYGCKWECFWIAHFKMGADSADDCKHLINIIILLYNARYARQPLQRPFLKFVGRHGTADIVTLCDMTSGGLHEGPVIGIFHPFRGQFHI